MSRKIARTRPAPAGRRSVFGLLVPFGGLLLMLLVTNLVGSLASARAYDQFSSFDGARTAGNGYLLFVALFPWVDVLFVRATPGRRWEDASAILGQATRSTLCAALASAVVALVTVNAGAWGSGWTILLGSAVVAGWPVSLYHRWQTRVAA